MKKETLIFNLKMTFEFNKYSDSDSNSYLYPKFISEYNSEFQSENNFDENYNLFEILISILILIGFIICTLIVILIIIYKHKVKQLQEARKINQYIFQIDDIPTITEELSNQQKTENNITSTSNETLNETSISLNSYSSLGHSGE